MSQILVSDRNLLIHVAFEPKIPSISKAPKSLKGYVSETFSSRYTKFGSDCIQLLPKGLQVLFWFLPEASFALRVLSLPLSVRPSVTKFVRAITHHPFKLGSPNLDQRCKTPWLRSLLFWGSINLDLQGQI